MRKRIVGVLAAVLMLVGVSPALASGHDKDYATYPPGNEGHCQELGDANAGENDNNGLSVADGATGPVIEVLNGDCDNSDNGAGSRP